MNEYVDGGKKINQVDSERLSKCGCTQFRESTFFHKSKH